MTIQHDLEFDNPNEFDKRLREAHELARLGLWELDLVSGKSKWSTELYAIYERDRSEGSFTKEEFDARLSPAEKELINNLEQRAISQRENYIIDHSFSFPNGNVKYLTQKVKPYVDGTGKVTKLYGITQDITDRKLAEIALEESRQLIASITDAIPDMLYVHDIQESNMIYSNMDIVQKLGYDFTDIKDPRSFIATNVVHPDDVAVYMARMEKQPKLADGEMHESEFRLTTKAGELLWFRNSEKVFKRDSEGRVKLIIGTTQNITIRKQQEQQINENSQLLSAMLENLPLVAFTIDQDGMLVMSKGEGLRAAGIYDNEHVGKNIFEIYPATADKIREALAGRAFRFESDGALYGKDWYYDNYIFKDPSGNGGLIGISWEISDNKKIEKALREEKKKVEEIADIKQQFVSAMSHEIRTPMNGVIGMTNLLVETSLNEEQREYVNLIRESADNLLVIINDILDFSKLSAGMMTIQQVEFDLSDLVSNTVKLLKHKAHTKGLKFSVSKDTQIPSAVIGDPIRLRQVLLNLLGNALKFTERGEIALSADVLNWDQGKVTVKFEVRDTGIGIAEDKMQTIFDNFIQVVDNNSQHTAGTGLGLSIARQLVEAQNGTISVNSRPGLGSTFSFVLTFDYVGESKLQAKVAEPVNSSLLNGLRILLVEDNPINQKVAKLTLEKMGAQVVVADNGKLGLDELGKATFNLVIMDIQMPVMNGFEATKHIREMEGAVRDIPIIAMTASAMAGEKDKCIAAGMSDFVSKPFTRDDILAAINDCLNPKTQKAEYTPASTVEMVTIDLRYLRQLQDNDEFISGIIEDFLSSTPDNLELLRNLVKIQDYQKVRELAHKGKQGYQVLGIKEAVLDWDFLEKADERTNKQSIDNAVHRLDAMSREAFKALGSILASFR